MSLALLQDNARVPRYAGAMTKPRPKPSESMVNNLKRLMRAKGLNQTELATLSGVSQTHIGGILRGESSCTVEMVDALAKPFGLSGWQMIMPRLPDDLVHSLALQHLMDAYIDAEPQARTFIDAAKDMALMTTKKK